MPTIFTHPAVPIAIGYGLGSNIIPPRLIVAGIAASVIPDLDVIAFKFGIAYADQFGHRGGDRFAGLCRSAGGGRGRRGSMAPFKAPHRISLRHRLSCLTWLA